MRLESAKNLIARDQSTALGIISDRQNVDLAKAATELNQEKTAFEAALAATAKISQLSLLDYIR
jgi:flagellar hook-associated protein 3 FlgL